MIEDRDGPAGVAGQGRRWYVVEVPYDHPDQSALARKLIAEAGVEPRLFV